MLRIRLSNGLKVPGLPTPEDLLRELDDVAFGQQEAKRALALAGYKQAMRASGKGGALDGGGHVLLIGPTGVGKTLLVRSLFSRLGVPVAFCSATSLVESGYVGEQVESTVHALLERAGGDVTQAEHGVIVIDEIDKIRRSAGSSRDISGEGVQNSLLTLLDGIRIAFKRAKTEGCVNTRGILFVCLGAFVGLENISAMRRMPDPVGFGARSSRVAEVACGAVMPEDLIEFGMIPEFVGRFSAVKRLHALTEMDLRQIIRKPNSPVMRRARSFFAAHNATVEFTDPALNAIVGMAVQQGTGARALNRILAAVLEPIEWFVASRGRSVRRVVVGLRTVRDGRPPRYEEWRDVHVPLAVRPLRNGQVVARVASSHRRVEIDRLRGLVFPDAGSDPSVHIWWSQFSEAVGQVTALEAMRGLADREATVADLYRAWIGSDSDDLQTLLADLGAVSEQQDDGNPF